MISAYCGQHSLAPPPAPDKDPRALPVDRRGQASLSLSGTPGIPGHWVAFLPCFPWRSCCSDSHKAESSPIIKLTLMPSSDTWIKFRVSSILQGGGAAGPRVSWGAHFPPLSQPLPCHLQGLQPPSISRRGACVCLGHPSGTPGSVHWPAPSGKRHVCSMQLPWSVAGGRPCT